MTSQGNTLERKLVWSGRPSVSVFYSIYGAIAVIVIASLTITEFWFGIHTNVGKTIFPRSFGGVPYPAELVTATLILLMYAGEVARSALLRKRNEYKLYDDCLYIDNGIVNLENVYLSPMAFSDARLFRTLGLRIVKRGKVIVDTNDQRHFQLQLIENPVAVHGLIRRTLGHPTVRLDK